MENIVMNEPPRNLHPIWYRHFGIQSQASLPHQVAAKASRPASTSAKLQPRTAQENSGWETTCDHRPPYGTPVGIRRRLAPHIWENTVVLPGDSRYPWPDHAPDSNT
jgi:hypothetical protein